MTKRVEDFSSQEVEECKRVAIELRDVPQPFVIELRGFYAYLMVGVLQLVLKHPDLPLHSRAFTVGMVETLRMLFEATGCRAVVSHIEQGPRT